MPEVKGQLKIEIDFFPFAKFVMPDLVKENIGVFEGFYILSSLRGQKDRIDHSIEVRHFGCTTAGLEAKRDVIALTCLQAGNLKNGSVHYCGLL